MNQITKEKLNMMSNKDINIIISDILKTISHQLQGKNYRVMNYIDRVDELLKLKEIIEKDYKNYL